MDWFDRIVPRVGNVLIVAAFALVFGSNIFTMLNTPNKKPDSPALQVAPQFERMAQQFTERPLTVSQFAFPDGEPFLYYTVEGGGYIFQTERFAADVYGYGGPMNLAVYIDEAGALQAFEFLKQRETARWLRRIAPWIQSLQGKNLFSGQFMEDVDVVSGATYSTRAIREILDRSGQAFLSLLQGKASVAPERPAFQWRPERAFALMLLLTCGALYLRYHPNRKQRLIFLGFVALTLGFGYNAQFSTFHVLTLVSWTVSLTGLTLMAYFLVILPLIVILFGNIYCGYLCPFGALQELAWELRPFKLNAPHKRLARYGRTLKFAILIGILVIFALNRNQDFFQWDVLLVAFQRPYSHTILLALAGLLILSMLSNRFWCRNLCPTGAFLAVLNRIRPIKRLRITPHVGRCDLGVRRVREADCICCDRCRHREKTAVTQRVKRRM